MDKQVTKISQPYLKLQFYFDNADRTPKQSYLQMLNTLVELGATLSGQGLAISGRGIEKLPSRMFGLDSNMQMKRLQFEPSNIDEVLDVADQILWHTYVYNAVGLADSSVAEEVTHVDISDNAVLHDYHPVAILSEYKVFKTSKSPFDVNTQIANARSRVLKRFFALIAKTRPLYGAITSAEALACPTDLSIGTDSLAFKDFYVDREFIGSQNYSYIVEIYDGAYMEEVGNGIYISTSPFFNPEGIYVDLLPDLPQRWDEVARIIGKIGTANK